MAGGSKLWAKYSPGSVIGAGEHSSVSILVRKSDGKRFACKSTRIDASSKSCSVTMKRVQVEAECLAKMSNHCGVVHYEEMVMDADAWHLIMELCDCSLADWIQQRGKIPEAEAALLVRHLAATLDDLHSAGIMHRDVKPDNILLVSAKNSSGGGSTTSCAAAASLVVKYADFGIAEYNCVSSAAAARKQLKDKVGTPRYVAPEVMCGSYWLPADVWSLGVTLYQMLAGASKVFSDYSTLGLLSDLKACAVTADACLDWDGIPGGAKDLIQKMMDKNPYKRPKPADILAHPWVVATAALALPSR
ncbi:hypothetical protein SELMODRAFT_158115 [Selaginella moellendorffii]|uniref:Protein kinase domain-containing protein n=1 Tax=Selaginella moellendorffii TaxID=88036 RepID=D8STH4_SELML|nr:calcium-dependent protein kinase SK5 [Selaginella moellendorffii]EFJ12201.1 hypothetical protein SELMODRAFT_158115 [Selaginella moellendorffii]|eukprot:XP_002986638.1 calcium-dependent protein kinase SK5 [Selaginella moellendorffii]